MFSWNLQVFRSMLINNLSEFHELLQKMQWFPVICIICENKPLSGPRRRAPRPERGAWRWLCTAWVHSRKPCKRRTANRNEQKFTEQKRTCAIWNDSVGLIQHFNSRWPCRPLFRKCNNTSEHEFRGTGRAPLTAWNYKCQRWEGRSNIWIKDIIIIVSRNFGNWVFTFDSL